MKKLILLPLLLTLLLLGGQQAHAQTPNLVMGYLPVAPCASQPVQLSVADLNGIYYMPYTYVQWNFGDGTNAWTFGNSTSHTYAPGNYQACAYVYDSLSNSQDTVCIFFTVDNSCAPSDIFEGTVYFDQNGNGTQDFGENGAPNAVVQIAPNGITISTDVNGQFSVPLPAGTFTLSCNPLIYYNVTQPVGNSYTLTSTASGNTTGNHDFGLTPIPGQQDVLLQIWANPHVPGFNRIIWGYVRNLGTQVQSGTMNITLDPNVTFVSVQPGGSYSAGVVTIPYSNLLPNTHAYYQFEVNASTTLQIGNTVTYTGVVNPVTGDLAPANNYDTTSSPVVASWDPNDKAAEAAGMGPNGEIEAGDLLTYTIRFQNEGNFPATFIFIRDTLDPDLDWSSFRILSSSHAMTHTQNSDKIQFYFDNIQLVPKSQDEAASQGFVRYQIAAKTSLVPGNEVTNTASIYFDYNPPVVTNTTLNTVWVATSTTDRVTPVSFELFPNPVLDHATLRFDAAGESWNLVVTDIQGRAVMTRNGERSGEIRILRGELPAGTYLFQLVSETGKVATGKMIAQ